MVFDVLLRHLLVSCRAGLLAILLHVQENNSPMTVAMQSTMLAVAKIRVTAHFNDE